MATVYDVWGFGKIIAAGPEVGATTSVACRRR